MLFVNTVSPVTLVIVAVMVAPLNAALACALKLMLALPPLAASACRLQAIVAPLTVQPAGAVPLKAILAGRVMFRLPSVLAAPPLLATCTV